MHRFVRRAAEILPAAGFKSECTRRRKVRLGKYLLASQVDAERVNGLSESVTRTWVECELSSIQMTRQQEIFLAQYWSSQ
jgi:hypothetical protein